MCGIRREILMMSGLDIEEDENITREFEEEDEDFEL